MKFNLKYELKAASRWLKRNGSTITSIVGTIGVLATGYFSYKAHDEKSTFETNNDPLEPTDICKVFWKPAISASGTIACIWLGHGLDQRQLAAMTAAYIAVKKSYDEYRSVADTYGPNADKSIRADIAREHWDKNYPNEDELYWDDISQRYFTASPLAVEKAKYNINKLFQQTGVVTLNDLYGFLGIDEVEGGDVIGWDVGMFDAIVSMCLEDYWIEFEEDEYDIDDGNGMTITAKLFSTEHYPVPLH